MPQTARFCYPLSKQNCGHELKIYSEPMTGNYLKLHFNRYKGECHLIAERLLTHQKTKGNKVNRGQTTA